MSGNCLSLKNPHEYVCDTVEEVACLPTTTDFGTGCFSCEQHVAPIGSTCVVGGAEGEEVAMYMLFSSGWKRI